MKQRELSGKHAVKILEDVYTELSGIAIEDMSRFEYNLLSRIANDVPPLPKDHKTLDEQAE